MILAQEIWDLITEMGQKTIILTFDLSTGKR